MLIVQTNKKMMQWDVNRNWTRDILNILSTERESKSRSFFF